MAEPSLDTAIWMAMRQRFEALPYPALEPGNTNVPSVEHIRVSQIKGQPTNDDLGGHKPVRPITLQILLHSPIGARYLVTQEKGGLIADAFPQGHADQMEFNGVRVVVTEPAFVIDGYRDENWWVTPVRVRCQVHA